MAKKERSEGQRKVSEALLDELLDGRDARDVIESGDLFRDLKKSLVERILDTEMDVHLEGEQASGSGNHRNGHNRKRVVSESGPVDLEVPRDREGTFEPLFVEKYHRRLPGFDERVVSLYARGMSTREIRAEIEEAYGVRVSAELVPGVTDTVHEEIREWQSRPLEEVYAVVYFDALRVKVRDEGRVRNKAVHLAVGVTCGGLKELLGMWTGQTEGASFRLNVMNELKSRGTRDVPVAVVDGLKGFPEAIESVFPDTGVQTCILHLVRNSLAHVSYRERRAVSGGLKAVYRAPSEAAAVAALESFEAGEWGAKYPMIAKWWRRSSSSVPGSGGRCTRRTRWRARTAWRGGRCASAATSRTTIRRGSWCTWRCATSSASGRRRRRTGRTPGGSSRSTSGTGSGCWTNESLGIGKNTRESGIP